MSGSRMARGGGPFRPLTLADLDEVLRIEQQAYEFPWSRGNFIDSLAAGYWVQSLWGPGACATSPLSLRAYSWASLGAGEVHLLNLTVAPWAQRQGHALELLNELVAWSREQGAEQLWLEVRPTNLRAIALYERYGMRIVGQRPGYYPAARGQREDALVMGLTLEPFTPPTP